MSSWFEEEYLYGVEEGMQEVEPSKIGAVRKNGEDFDDAYLARLKMRLETSVFPKTLYRLYFETDDFRRFVRIYVDSVLNVKFGKKLGDIDLKIIIPAEEIRKRLSGSELERVEEELLPIKPDATLIEVPVVNATS